MVEQENKTISWFTSSEDEIMEKLVSPNHVFRKLSTIIDFEKTVSPYRKLYSTTGAEGIDVIKGFKSLLIQFWEDYSDREMEKVLQENIAVKWFCGFSLLEKTPDHTYFCKLRKRIGTKNIADIFNNINNGLREKGLFGDVFKFIDASSIITKTALWDERDKAIARGEEKLNNKNVQNYSADKDARFGAKGKNKIWFGHKRNVCVDMRYGLIEKVVVTPGNVLDFQVMKNVCPRNAMIFADKLYDTKKAKLILKGKCCHDGIIKKNSNKTKNHDLDSWKSKTRMPFECTFSKLRKRAKFRSCVKVLMQCYMESICYNLKKAIVVLPT
jgi:transposase, IS5 family